MKELLRELETAFEQLNTGFFEGALAARPQFLWQPKARVAFRHDSASDHMIVGGRLATLDREEVLGELLHEMIHMWNRQHGIEDCNEHSYHNRKFCDAALSVGLGVTKKGKGTGGWAVTLVRLPARHNGHVQIPSAEAVYKRERVFESISLNYLRAAQKLMAKNGQRKKETVLFTLKYQCRCPAPHNSIRSGRRPHGKHPLDVICQVCGHKFICVDETFTKEKAVLT